MVLQNVLVGIFFYFLDVENGDKRQTWPKKMALNELCLWWKILVQNIGFLRVPCNVDTLPGSNGILPGCLKPQYWYFLRIVLYALQYTINAMLPCKFEILVKLCGFANLLPSRCHTCFGFNGFV